MKNFFNADYKRNLIKIAFPIMISSLISQVQMLIDRVFLGRLDVLYMSAVSNATTPMWTTMSVIFALTVGATILISQAMGRENMEEAKVYTASMFKYNNFISFALFLFWTFCSRLVYKAMGVSENVMEPCVTYTIIYAPVFLITGIGSSCNALLQTNNYTKPLIIQGIIRSGLNILLDYLLIFGNWGFPEMGITGAALATTLAEFIGGTVYLIIIIKTKKIKLKPRFVEILKSKVGPYIQSVKLGIPSAAEEFAWNFGNLMLIRLLNSINEYAAGIYTIIFSIEILPITVFTALGNATLTLTGKETGRKDFVQFKKIVKTSVFWSSALSAVNLIVFLLFPKQIIGLFTTDKEVIISSVLYLLIVGIDLFPKAGNIIVGNGIRGYGDTKWMLYTQLFGTVFVIGVAAIFVFVFNLGITGVCLAVVLDEFTRCVINYVRYRRIGI